MKALARVRIMSLLTALLLAALICGCEQKSEDEELPEVPRNVRILALQATDMVEYLEITGPVTPVRSADISAEESGVVASVPHDKGDQVAEGGVLIELDRSLLRAEMEANSANAELQDYNVEQIRQLHAAGKVSQLELLTAQAEAAGARSLLEVSERRYVRAAVAAPFAGVVADRYVEPGEFVAPGVQVVARVIDPYTLKLTGTVTEREVTWVHLGTRVVVKLDGIDEAVAGEVTWVGFEADILSGKFKVEIEIPNRDLTLRSGVVGRARVERRRHEGVISVPRDAILSTSGGNVVYVVEDDRAQQRVVTLGPDQGLMVLITEGLAVGDLLVVRGHRELIQNSLVEVTETTTADDGFSAEDPPEIRDEGSRLGSDESEEAGA